MSLERVLARLALTKAESGELVTLLSASVAGLSPGPGMRSDDAQLLGELSDALLGQLPSRLQLGDGGYLWRGRPPFVSDCELGALQRDAAEKRVDAIRASRHRLFEGAGASRIFGASAGFLGFVRDLLPVGMSVEPTSSFYHYYENVEDRVEPHLDTADFALSCLLLLQHRHDGNPGSRFYLCQPGQGPTEIGLREGDAIVFYSGSVVHARSAPRPGESVVTASWGFRTRQMPGDW